MYNKVIKRLMGVLLSLIFVGVMVGTASAVTDVYLRAEPMMLSVPDGLGGTTNVPMWGFAQESTFGATAGTPSVPGPVIDVPPGETLLRIHVDNNLPDPISIQINGLAVANNTGPVWANLDNTGVTSGARPAGDYSTRVRSFSHETLAGNGTDVTYDFDVTGKSGTFMYSSGTNPAKQVQMGLYGAMKKDVAVGEAYPGVLYDKELILVYSEVDPVMNAAIAAGTYGYNAAPPAGWITSSLLRDPKYFLVNGMAFNPALPDGGGLDPINAANPIYPGSTVLVRFLNAGYDTHVPQLLNMYMGLVAEDGNAYKYAPRQQYGVQLPAGKTVDAILALTATGRFPTYDAAHHLTNNGAGAPGGMLAYLDIIDSCFFATSPFSDIEPTGGEGDVDGLDLEAFSGLAPAVIAANIAAFAADFGQLCP